MIGAIALHTLSAVGGGIPCAADDVIAVYDDRNQRTLDWLCHDEDGFLFASRSRTLVAVDVRDPLNPVRLDFLETTIGSIYNIDRIDGGLIVWAATNIAWVPFDPVDGFGAVEVVLSYPSVLRGYAREGNTVYLSTDDGVEIYDFAAPNAPTGIGGFVPESFGQLELGGNILTIRLGNIVDFYYRGLGMSFDYLGRLSIDPNETVRRFESGGGFVHVATDQRIFGVDPFNHTQTLYEIPLTGLEVVNQLTYRGNSLYLALDRLGVRVIELYDLDSPVVSASYITPDVAYGLAVGGGLLYTSINRGFVSITDLERPSVEVEDVAETVGSAPARDLCLHQGMACVAAGMEGLQLYSVGERGEMAFVSRLDLGGSVEQVASDGDRLYARVAGDRLVVLELDGTLTPAEIGSIPFVYDAREMVAHEGKLVVASGVKGVFFLDFTQPTMPGLAAHRVLPGWAGDIEMDWPRVWVSNGRNELHTIDCSNLSDPLVTRALGLGVYSDACAVLGTSLFVGQRMDVEQYDISDPLNPVPVDSFVQDSETINQMIAHDGLLVLHGHDSNNNEPTVRVYEISSDGTTLRAEQEIPRFAENIASVGDRVIAASYEDLLTLDFAACPECLADLNGDETTDFFDVTAFIVAFSTQDDIADWNNDGAWDFFDVAGFIAAYSQGCQ